MDEYEISSTEANRRLEQCDKMKEEKTERDPYLEGVRDCLGWLLGHYDPPYCFD